ncbi:phage baseplate assembly protein [Muricoccus vinaceus]|uniref:Phage baseplate assembly protein n=1 Tax=Muricoccus vinaceus TaxID=424704 RepID=A0ABV6IL39_9PROT
MPDDAPIVEIPEVVVSPSAPADLPLPLPPPPGDYPDDEMTIEVDGKVFGGWDTVQVVRSCEQMPSSFTISLTERYPGEADEVVIEPGQACKVMMGKDTVLTGYIDRYIPALDARRHTVTIMGRSKTQDLVDCAAIFDTFQISGQTVGQIAVTLAGKYGISVSLPAGEGPVVPQLNLQLGETTWDVIERLCRFAKFLCYDDAEGNIVLRPVSTERHSSGVREGENVISAWPDYGMDQRFSEYQVYPLSVLPLMQAQDAAGGGGLPAPIGQAKDEGVKRLRRRIIILEHSGTGPIEDAARERAEWEQARRLGRSEDVTVSVDSWRDSEGRLWEPNRLADVHIPACQVKDETWIIGDVTFTRGEGGTTARLHLMNPRGFDPQYDPLFSFGWQIRQAAEEGAQRQALEAGGASRISGTGPGV